MVTRATSRRGRGVGLVLGWALVGALALGACGADDEAATASDPTVGSTAPVPDATPVGAELPQPVQALDIEGGEYVFTIDPSQTEDLRAGWTLVRFDNVGVEAHQVMFARLKDGVDITELAAAGEGDSSGAGAIEFVDMIGGVSYIDAGHRTTALVDLPEGVVLAMCYVPDADGVAHALMGMSTVLAVGPADGATSGSTAGPGVGSDRVVGTIEMTADGYQLPEDLIPGWYHVVNADTADPGRGLHELALLRLDEAVDGDELEGMVGELADNVVPEVGLDAVGGMGAISAGFDGYLHLDLEPGEYLAVDFMPDPGDPRPHMVDGYYGRFTVGEP